MGEAEEAFEEGEAIADWGEQPMHERQGYSKSTGQVCKGSEYGATSVRGSLLYASSSEASSCISSEDDYNDHLRGAGGLSELEEVSALVHDGPASSVTPVQVCPPSMHAPSSPPHS